MFINAEVIVGSCFAQNKTKAKTQKTIKNFTDRLIVLKPAKIHVT